MRAADLRQKTTEELNVELENLLKQHFSLRMNITMQQSTKTSDLKTVRRSIARVRTILTQKKVA